MKNRAIVPLMVLGLCVAPGVAGADAPKDALCPRAVPKLVAYADAATTNDLAKIEHATRAVADAYAACATDARVSMPIEPTVNYDKTRRAQFLVVLGRTQAAGGNAADAIATLRQARADADDVATWVPSSMSYSTSNRTSGTSSDRNADRQGSRYREAALQVRAAADEQLAALQAAPAPAPDPTRTPG